MPEDVVVPVPGALLRYWLYDAPPTDPDRGHQLGQLGIPLPLQQRLTGQNDADAGLALADATVAHALYALASSGKCPTATLTWAKQRLGFGEGEPHDTPDPHHLQQSAAALAALHALVDDLAQRKAEGAHDAHPLADHSAAQPAAPRHGDVA